MKPHHGASGTPAKFAGYQADFPGLGRGLRGASGTPAKYAEYQADFLGLGRGLRSLKQVLDWLRAVCAASNKRSIGHHSQR